jgi:hypothetical protein
MLTLTRYGKELIELYSAFKNATAEIQQRVIIVELNWMKTHKQIEILERFWDTLEAEHQEQQTQILEVLATKISAAIRQVQKVRRRYTEEDGNVQVNRIKYALIKGYIDTAIQDLETWQKYFDPSWYLMLRIASPVIDRELADQSGEQNETLSTARGVRSSIDHGTGHQGSVFRGADELASAKRERLPFCTAELMQRSTKSTKSYIVDSVPCIPEVNIPTLQKMFVTLRENSWPWTRIPSHCSSAAA